MTMTAEAVLLGVIAAGVTTMAVLQAAAAVVALRLARRTEALVGRLERDLQPAMERLSFMSGEAARAASIAAAQVARVDQVLDRLAVRADEAMASVHRAVEVPQREVAALAAGLRATVAALREARRHARRRRDGTGAGEEDPLFIG